MAANLHREFADVSATGPWAAAVCRTQLLLSSRRSHARHCNENQGPRLICMQAGPYHLLAPYPGLRPPARRPPSAAPAAAAAPSAVAAAVACRPRRHHTCSPASRLPQRQFHPRACSRHRPPPGSGTAGGASRRLSVSASAPPSCQAAAQHSQAAALQCRLAA